MSVDASLGWAGQQVEVGQIEEALREAWREEAVRAPEARGSLAARTNVLNLIVHAASRAQLEQVGQAIAHLGVHHPSRAILLLGEETAEDSALKAFVNTNVQELGDRRLLFEQVTIMAQGEAAKHLPGVVDPLLLAELPDFLWWLGQPPFRQTSFTRMIDLVDRLIIDSASFHNMSVGLRELAEMTIVPHSPAISDFAWERLRPWRELVAQFFDPADYVASLETIEEVNIDYEPTGGRKSSGFSEGLLALGWACSRLGWQVDRRPIREGLGAYRWELNTGGRLITVALRPEHQDDEIVGLRTLTLVAGGQAPGTFEVYRESGVHLTTRVNVPGAPNLDQIMRATEPDENDLLLQSLGEFGHDRTYDGALVFAAQLAGGVESLE